MTQAHVNTTIDTHFRLDLKLLCVDVEGDWGTISSEMDPLTVSFYIPSKIHKVHFCVNLASGKCSWYKINHTTHPPTVIVMKSDIAKWTLRAEHDGDGDEAEYDDKDKEPCPQRLHNPTHTR